MTNDVVDNLMISASIKKFTCPCCGFLVFDEPPGSYASCPICAWQDDVDDLVFGNTPMGPNKVSLFEAQKNYERYAASEPRLRSIVRRPRAVDARDPEWFPLTEKFVNGLPNPDTFRQFDYPKDRTRLYYWSKDYLFADDILEGDF